ncbi:hypothetical protein ONA91_15340 [Micromonospora sp. DR5-3]|uniref:hypothetical protein n=1 Tax=unclassified Micromonospora TaxID=2617518 RepID=UPI0011D84FD1|nr:MULTISPECIES: hypothetical protein [unclassified Micromonospora]MCW3815819.1 hypothetical protein [Micromonospora sp. DR5-3]TYC21197.1 hypothetical protein FXF52_27145 [Micromonospora sp. MP36]
MRRFIEAHTVHIFCHLDELEQITAAADEPAAKLAAEGTPSAPHKVHPSPVVPAGAIHVMRGTLLHRRLIGCQPFVLGPSNRADLRQPMTKLRPDPLQPRRGQPVGAEVSLEIVQP